jgi:hypothetical protein
MKLNQPNIVTVEHRVDLPDALAYLAGGEPAFASMTLKPGGHLNPAYLEALEAVDLAGRVRSAEMKDLKGEALLKAQREAQGKAGRDMLRALYRHCLVDWSTNIQDNGKAMECSEENFMALADCGIPEITAWVVGAASRVSKVADFIGKADKEAEKN